MTLVSSSEGHPAEVSPGAALRRSPRLRRSRRLMTPYLLLAPAAAVYLVFTVYPIYRQFDISFYNWHIFPGASNPFLGWANYTAIFHDSVVRTAAWNSFLFIVITVPIQMAIGLFAAAMLTDRLPGSMFWRAAVYIPVVTSWVVVSWVFSYIFASQGGVMNALVGLFAGHTVSIDWTAQTWTANGVIWLLSIWKGVGWNTASVARVSEDGWSERTSRVEKCCLALDTRGGDLRHSNARNWCSPSVHPDL
jgi:multiple sugar transport system permease protein